MTTDANAAPDEWKNSTCREVGGAAVIPNVDVDGDGLMDAMYFDCPGSGSISKPDVCKAEIRFGGAGDCS